MEPIARQSSQSQDLTNRARALREQGMSIRCIGKTLGITPNQAYHYAVAKPISSLKKQLSSGFKVSSSREEILNKIFSYSPRAIENMKKLAEKARKEDVRFRANADFLDRAGFKPVERLLSLNAIEDMSSDELNSALLDALSKITLTNNIEHPADKTDPEGSDTQSNEPSNVDDVSAIGNMQ